MFAPARRELQFKNGGPFEAEISASTAYLATNDQRVGAGRSVLQARAWRPMAVLPDTDEQKAIAAIFDAQAELLLSLGTQLTAARRVKQSLPENMLTGRIRLKP